jgi:hypothetical protein
MANKTRKASMKTLQKLVSKYKVTRSVSTRTIAGRLWKLGNHVMTLKNLKRLENYLGLPPAKRFKGQRFYLRNNGQRLVPV